MFDTVNFGEVVSRMRRFQGMLAKVTDVIDMNARSPDVLAKLPAELKAIVSDIGQLRRMVKALPTARMLAPANRRRSSPRPLPTRQADPPADYGRQSGRFMA